MLVYDIQNVQRDEIPRVRLAVLGQHPTDMLQAIDLPVKSRLNRSVARCRAGIGNTEPVCEAVKDVRKVIGAMHLHEYQAKKILARYGIRAPIGEFAATPQQAADAARKIGSARFVLKSQVHVNNRRAIGQVVFVDDQAAVASAADALLGTRTPAGSEVRGLIVEEAIGGHEEIYAAVTVAHASGCLMLVAGPQKAMEEAERTGKTALSTRIVRVSGNRPTADFASLACELSDDPVTASNLAEIFRGLATAALSLDATLVELSPLAVLPDRRLMALDARMSIDDNALFRQTEMAALRHDNERVLDRRDGHERALEAQRFNINYVALQGDVGVVSNGAGLALATLDAIHDQDGEPANFMDIRTTATSTDIAHGLGILLSDPQVRSILVNVHGGGMQKCDTIAEAIGMATRRHRLTVPLVIRMTGNNADFAVSVLENNGVPYHLATTLDEAVSAAIDAARRKAA